MHYRSVGKSVGVTDSCDFLRTGPSKCSKLHQQVGSRLNRNGATLTPVRATEATELVAVEVCRQSEDSGQDISVGMVERVLHQLQAHRPGLWMRGVRGGDRSGRRRCLSDHLVMAAAPAASAGTAGALGPLPRNMTVDLAPPAPQ